MKERIPYHPFEHFVFRTPLFPCDYLQNEEKSINSNAFAESLFIASPELSNEVAKLQQTPKMSQKEKERINDSLYRYYQRACTRPTPFGLFAGCSMGTIGEHTLIQLAGQKEYWYYP